MSKLSDKIITIIIFVSILLLAVLFFFLPKKDYSENENRYLAKTPVFTFSHLIDGEYTESIEDYTNDHFPARDFFISLKTAIEELTGKNKINGVYLADDDYLIGEYKSPQNTARIIKTFNKFSNRITSANPDINIRLMLIPTKVSMLSDKLPTFASSNNQLETLNAITSQSGIPTVDVLPYLSEAASEKDIYFKTDHHWNTYGAFAGYRAYCDNIGITGSTLKDYSSKSLTNDFHGTLSAKVNRFNEKGDEIIIYENNNADLTVTYADTKESFKTLYNYDYLEKRDKYSLFLDNLHPLVTIENSNSSTDRVLMIIKDSYANCMIPFLASDFNTIYVFDTRYYKEGPGGFFEEHPEITDVLILYNMNTIDTDTGIRGIY